MSYYDTVRSSYDLGPGFKKELHTKDLDNDCSTYWIDPNGCLYHLDYSHTQSIKFGEHNFELIKSNKGRVSPCIFSGEIEVYPAKCLCSMLLHPLAILYLSVVS